MHIHRAVSLHHDVDDTRNFRHQDRYSDLQDASNKVRSSSVIVMPRNQQISKIKDSRNVLSDWVKLAYDLCMIAVHKL